MLKLLLGHGADYNVRTKNEQFTALHVACKHGFYEGAVMLMARGASADDKTPNGWKAMHWAMIGGDDKLVALLTAAGVDVNDREEKSNKTPMMVAADSGNIEAVKFLMKNRKLDLKAADNSGRTALHHVMACENTESRELIADALINQDEFLIDLNKPDKDGNTPLHLCVENGVKSLATTLIQLGVDPTARNAAGQYAFDLAKDPAVFADEPILQKVWVESGIKIDKENVGEGAPELGCHPGDEDAENRRLEEERFLQEIEIMQYDREAAQDQVDIWGEDRVGDELMVLLTEHPSLELALLTYSQALLTFNTVADTVEAETILDESYSALEKAFADAGISLSILDSLVSVLRSAHPEIDWMEEDEDIEGVGGSPEESGGVGMGSGVGGMDSGRRRSNMWLKAKGKIAPSSPSSRGESGATGLPSILQQLRRRSSVSQLHRLTSSNKLSALMESSEQREAMDATVDEDQELEMEMGIAAQLQRTSIVENARFNRRRRGTQVQDQSTLGMWLELRQHSKFLSAISGGDTVTVCQMLAVPLPEAAQAPSWQSVSLIHPAESLDSAGGGAKLRGKNSWKDALQSLKEKAMVQKPQIGPLQLFQLDAFGNSALHIACSRQVGSGAIVQVLCEQEMEVNAANEAGETPLHLVARLEDCSRARILLRYGADCTLRNLQGETPLQLAQNAARKWERARGQRSGIPARGASYSNIPRLTSPLLDLMKASMRNSHAQACRVEGVALTRDMRVNEEIKLVIHATTDVGVHRPNGGEEFEAELSALGLRHPIPAHDMGGGRYEIRFTPAVAAQMRLFVRLRGQQLAGSPFALSVIEHEESRISTQKSTVPSSSLLMRRLSSYRALR